MFQILTHSKIIRNIETLGYTHTCLEVGACLNLIFTQCAQFDRILKIFHYCYYYMTVCCNLHSFSLDYFETGLLYVY